MKSIFLFLLTIAIFSNTFAQRRYYQPQQKTYDDYMAKSRRFKTTGWILLGAGVGLMVGGIVLMDRGLNENDNGYYGDEGNSTLLTGELLVTGGTLSACGSIPFLVIGGILHKKAMRASAFLEMEKVPNKMQTGIPLQPFPAVGVHIGL
jgi:hypothetical protein